ncbi:MAG: 50S ribosomal protein L18 [Spartobacteria bacterium]|nr:50S ribosomal protein L18 [Spartobacteria bacterium]
MTVIKKEQYRVRRHYRVRHKIVGTAERPRLSVFISNKHIYAQVIDDAAGKTLFSASSMGSEEKSGGVNASKAAEVGKKIAASAKETGIEAMVFDRGGFKYGKRMASVADAVREAGIKI